MDVEVYCLRCGKKYNLNEKVWKCSCGSPLDIRIEGLEFSKEDIVRNDRSLWRYQKALPVAKRVTLGEGFTPIVQRKINGFKVLFQLDYLNPTGSFKDRGATVEISHLKSIGVREIVEDSSGNAGAAMSAYATIAGISITVFTPATTPRGKVFQIESYGATIRKVEGDRERVFQEALKYCERKGAFYAGHNWNPFFIQGIKTVSYEVWENDVIPSVTIIPVGGGGLLLGVYKGFKELYELGFIDSIPRIFGVQTYGYTSVYDILHEPCSRRVERVLADGIAVPKPPRAFQVAEAIKSTRGDVVLVSNSEVYQGFRKLAKLGFFVEPTSATVYVAFEKLVEAGEIETGDIIFLPLTGIGHKAIEKLVNYKVFEERSA